MPRSVLAVVLVFGLTPFASEQPSVPASTLPHVRLQLPEGVPAESIRVESFLSGPFGGYGQILSIKNGQRFVDVLAGVDTRPATNVKVTAYLPGCDYVTLDLPIDGESITKDLPCNAVGTRRLYGQIHRLNFKWAGPFEIRVIYEPLWSFGFFGIKDGMIAVVDVAKATPRQDEFTVDLPDFAHLGEGFFEFSLIQPETRRSSRLTPLQNGRPSFDLKAQSSYEAPVEFAVEAPRAFATQ